MEGMILKELNFNVTTPSSYLFLQRYAKLMNGDQKTYMMARYLIELALVDYSMMKYSPSNLAASAMYLSAKIFKFRETWNPTVQQASKYSE